MPDPVVVERTFPRGPRPSTIPLRRLLPNILTTLSLCSGLAALHFALAGDWDRALSAIAVAAVFDVLDGGAARLLKATSRFGAVLDSLSDFLSFGVAPALILHQWMLKDADVLGMAATMTFVLCSALRLARFTSSPSLPSSSPLARFFTGLPTPAAASIVLIPVMLEAARQVQYRLPEWLVVVHVVFVAWLMVSRQPCFSLKKIRVKRRLVMPLMVALGLIVVAAAKAPWLTAACVAAGYMLTIPLSILRHAALKRELIARGEPVSPVDPAQESAAEGEPIAASR